MPRFGLTPPCVVFCVFYPEPVRTLDEITGIEGIEYRKTFLPGVDFLALAAVVAAGLAGASFIFRKVNKTTQGQTPP